MVDNPIDVASSRTTENYLAGISACLQDRGIDLVMSWSVLQALAMLEEIVSGGAELQSRAANPITSAAMGGNSTVHMTRFLEEADVPAHGSIVEWVAAGSALCEASRIVGREGSDGR